MTDIDVPAHNAAAREALARFVARGNITPDSSLHQMLDYAERHGLAVNLAGEQANLWGFGKVSPLFFEAEGGFWVGLSDLVVPTGLSYEELYSLFEEDESDEERGDLSVRYVPYTHGISLPIVHHDFVMRAFSMHSPWAPEFYEKTKELMSHAMIHSGLADALLGSPTGFTAVAEMTDANGKAFKVNMPIRAFDPTTNVPIVAAPFDDSEDDDEIPITDLTSTYSVVRAADAIQAFLGPGVSEEEAREIAMRPVAHTEHPPTSTP